MLDFLRNLTKSEAEKRQETLTAYLDNALTPAERQAFEDHLQNDTVLQASLEQQRLVKQNIGQLPSVQAPRNFTLDPAAYGRPASQPAIRLYPVMRTATVLAAVMLISLFALNLFQTSGIQSETAADQPIAASNINRTEETGAAEESAPAPQAEVFTEQAGEAQTETAAEAPMEEPPQAASEEAAVEEEFQAAEPAAAAEGETANDSAALATEQTVTITKEAYPGVVGGNGSGIAYPSPPTTTLSYSPTITTNIGITIEPYGTAPAPLPTTVGLGDEGFETSPTSPFPALEIGLGILFLVLLAATLILRRQL